MPSTAASCSGSSRAVGGGADAGVARAPPHRGAAGRDQAALLEAAQDAAVGADRARPAPAPTSPLPAAPRAPPAADPESLAAAQRRLAGGGDLGPQLSSGAHPLARGTGPRRQHQLQPARGRRAVLLGDPEAEPDQLRRRARLERFERLGEPLRGQRGGLGEVDDDAEHAPPPERHPDHAADLQAGHRLGQAVVERAAQRAGCGQRLDLRIDTRSGYGGTRAARVCGRPMALNLSPGEQVIFQGHPSWRAILGFYLKGILVAASSASSPS